MKKICSLVASLFVLGSFAFAEDGFSVSFSNELSSDIVEISTADGTGTFAGISNETVIDFESEKVTAGIDTVLTLNVNEDGSPTGLSWSGEDFDWYATYSPISVLTLGLSADNYIEGSYLIAEDDNVGTGNLGSDGFSIFVNPIENLKIGLTFPFGFDEENAFDSFNIGLGAEYDFSFAKVGVAVQNPFNSEEFGIGVYGSIVGVENLVVNLGYTYNALSTLEGLLGVESVEDGDKNLINLSASYEVGSFAIALDYVTTFNEKFFAKFDAGYGINDSMTVGLEASTANSYSDITAEAISVQPKFAYATESVGEFEIGVCFNFQESTLSTVTIPFSWVYEF